jgi:DNA-binding MarR family transcriptional regulator
MRRHPSVLRAAYPPSMIDPLALLEATDHRGQNTTPEIAAILDVTENETVQALRQAERDGLVHEETDESRNVAPDFNRQVWFLTDAGREKRDRLKVIP